jgi:hypothetical protein
LIDGYRFAPPIRRNNRRDRERTPVIWPTCQILPSVELADGNARGKPVPDGLDLVWYSGLALKQLKKLSRPVQTEILDYMDKRIAMAANPRDFGKSLRHDKFGLWRYRSAIIESSAN